MFGTSSTASVPAEAFPAVWARLNSLTSVMRGQSQRVNGRDRAGERGWTVLWRAWCDACGWERLGQQTWCWTRPLFPYLPLAAAPGTYVQECDTWNCQSQPWGNEHFSSPTNSLLHASQQIRPSKRILQRQSWGRGLPWKQARLTVLLSAAAISNR